MEQEIKRFLTRVWRDQDRMGHLDLKALELALRSSMHQIGRVLLEKLLNSDEGGYAGTGTKWRVCLHADQGGRGGLSGRRSGVHHLCWSDRNGRGVWHQVLLRG